MGASQSDLTSEEVAELCDETVFTPRDVKALYNRFRKLDRSMTGVLSQAEFQLIPELSMNPLCPRIIALFEQDGMDNVNFRQFVYTLNVFHPKASPDKKRELAFRCYDVDADGKISQSDLMHVMKLLVGSNIDDDQLRVIVAQTISSHASGTGITKEEFQEAIGDEVILETMTIPF